MNRQERAARILAGYLRSMYEEQGMRWDGENEGEIEDVVQCIIDAAVAEMKRELQQPIEPERNP